MINQMWWEDPTDNIQPCDDCPDPGKCITECKVSQAIAEDSVSTQGEANELY